MLQAQINYWQLQETKRHDIVTEGETAKHNRATEDLGYKSLAETIRHNEQQEKYWFESLAETKQHNRETEAVSWANNAVQNRQADAAMVQSRAAMIQAAAASQNAETNRLRMWNDYSLGVDANAIAQENAETNAMNAQTAADKEQHDWLANFMAADNNRDRTVIEGEQLDINRDKQTLSESEFKHDKAMDIWNNSLKTLSTATDVAQSVYGMATGDGSGVGGAIGSKVSEWKWDKALRQARKDLEREAQSNY